MRSAVVLDKNYLQGTSAANVAALALAHRMIMPGPLFFELLTTDTKARRNCFAKLPQTQNPVDLVDHIGLLLKQEMALGKPAGQPSTHHMQISFQFNKRLLDADYSLPTEAQEALADISATVESDIDQLVDLSEQTPYLFPGLLVGTTEARGAAFAEVQSVIAAPSKMLDFYSVLESPDPTAPWPLITAAPEDWALIRWLQVKMLFSVDLFVRYKGALRASLTPAVRTRLEHDIQDAQILALGVLEGALATHERKLRRWFRLLRPNGHLHPGDAQ